MTYTEGGGERGRPENPETGDLYYDRYAGFKHVRYVSVEGQPRRVTHRWDGNDWQQFDPGPDQWVITVPKGYDNPAQVVKRVVEQVLHQETHYILDSRVAHVVGNGVADRFGLDNEVNATLGAAPLTVRVDPLEEIRLAFIALLTTAPEHGWDERIGQLGAAVDNVGFASDAEQYSLLIDGHTDGFGEVLPGGLRGPGRAIAPLLSEPVYYALLNGKEDGRVLKARIKRLMELTGVKESDL